VDKIYNRLVICLDDELTEWLNEKARNGYKKGTFIRKVLEDYKKAEVIQNGSSA
jgi:hypothetical protein